MSCDLTDERSPPELPNEVIFMILDLAFSDLVYQLSEEPVIKKQRTLCQQACDIAAVSTVAYKSAHKRVRALEEEAGKAADKLEGKYERHTSDGRIVPLALDPDHCGRCDDLVQQYKKLEIFREGKCMLQATMMKLVKGFGMGKIYLHGEWESVFDSLGR